MHPLIFYALSRRLPGPPRHAGARPHWSVENRCHWMLKVVFEEDDCQVRDAKTAQNLPHSREPILISHPDEPTKASLRTRCKFASFDPDIRLVTLHFLSA